MKKIILRTSLTACLLGIASCSFLYKLDAEQCSTTADCEDRGIQNAYCSPAGLCVLEGSDGSVGGSGGTGGGDGSGGGSSGTGGGTGGGDGGPLGCQSHAECIEDHDGEPYLCREGSCIPLKNNAVEGDAGMTGQCSLVLGEENLRHPQYEPYVFGALSYIGPTNPASAPATLNYTYAIDEFTQENGIRIAGQNRLPVAVVCNAVSQPNDVLTPEEMNATIDHLVNTVGVNAIIAPLQSKELLTAFDRARDTGKDVFFLSPYDSDSSLTSETNDGSGLLWHLLANSTVVAQPYMPLVRRVEDYLRQERGLEGDLRLALIQNDTSYLADIGSELIRNLRWNGTGDRLSVAQNGSNFLALNIKSEYTDPNENVAEKLVALQEFQPHIVVSATGDEFYAKMLVPLEANWSTTAPGQVPPFYVLSPFHAGDNELIQLVQQNPNLAQRLVGVNAASAEDTTLYNIYYAGISGEYPDAARNLAGTENFYDAVYFLLYAVTAAGNVPGFDGSDIAVGMTKLVNGTTEFEIGRPDLAEIRATLALGAPIEFHGTLGPPDFNLQTGAREGNGSVYCLSLGSGGIFQYNYDVLRYDKSAEALATNSIPCITSF